MPSQSENLKGKDNSISIGKKYTLESKILAEERPYWVRLPSSYEDTYHAPQHYPVLYLLDGDSSFYWVAGVMNFMGGMQTPEFIVVAIPNTDRTRDLTPTHTLVGYDGKEAAFLKNSGGGERFLSFVEEELFPEIESNYRTLDYRLFVGHSFGGLLVLHALLNRPGMFHNHLAIDPALWWDNQILTAQAEQLLSEAKKLEGGTYISLAHHHFKDLDDPEFAKTIIRAFAKVLELFESPDFRFKLAYFPSEDHGTVPLLSLYHGLLHIFEGYKPNIDEVIEQPALLNPHFKSVSERLGVDFKAPEAWVNGLGLHFLNDLKDTDKAFEALELNAANYPESYNVYKSLAEAYEVKGEKELAIEHYLKALELNPDVQEVKDQLQTLREADS